MLLSLMPLVRLLVVVVLLLPLPLMCLSLMCLLPLMSFLLQGGSGAVAHSQLCVAAQEEGKGAVMSGRAVC